MNSLDCRHIGARPKTHKENTEIRELPIVGGKKYKVILPIYDPKGKVNSKTRSIVKRELRERKKLNKKKRGIR